jgi:uncharacterized membrane protein
LGVGALEEKNKRLARETIEDKKTIKIDEAKDIFETAPEKKSRGIMLAQFFIPWGIALTEISMLFLFLDWDTFRTLGFWMTIYFFPPLGKESVIPAAIGLSEISGMPDWLVSIDPLLIALAIASIDIIVGLFLIWNFDFAKKIPILGKFIMKLESRGGALLAKNKYIETLSFIGVTLFVIVPFQGSGAVGASIIGRMIGMNPYKVWAAIILGAVSGCLMIAFAFSTFKTIFKANWIIGLVLLIVIIVITVAYLIRRRRCAQSGKDMKECMEGKANEVEE